MTTGGAHRDSLSRSTSSTILLAWAVNALIVALVWRKTSAAPDGHVTEVFIAVAIGFLGLLLLTCCLRDRDR